MGRPGALGAALCAAALAAALCLGATSVATGETREPRTGHTATVARIDPALNPLANRAWGVYEGDGDQSWEPYVRAHGNKKTVLAAR